MDIKIKQREVEELKGTIICYGDSNTYGYDPGSCMEGRYPREIRWTGILEEQSGWKIKNHGINGRCIPHDPSQLGFAVRQVEQWKKETAPVRLWIMLGTNDLLMNPGFTAEDTAARMKIFLKKLQQEAGIKKENMRLRLIAPPPVEYGAWVNEERLYQQSRRLEEEYRKTAEELGTEFTGTGDWEIPLVFDGVHFSEKGHRKFAEKLLEEIIWQKE